MKTSSNLHQTNQTPPNPSTPLKLVQLDVSDFGTTDALSISISKGGIPTAIVGVAVKNLHTSYGISSLEDINETVKILEVLMKNPPKTCID